MSIFSKQTDPLAEAMAEDLAKATFTCVIRSGKTVPIAEATPAEKYVALRTAFAQENADLTARMKSAIAAQEAQKKELALACISAGCIDVAGDSDEAKATAALAQFSHSDLINSFRGAVNKAVASIGINASKLPSTLPAAHQDNQAGMTATEKCLRAKRNGNN